MHQEKSSPAPTPRKKEKERERPAELLGAADIGLQARLLVGGLSNPHVIINKNNLLPIKDAGAQGITEQVSKKYQRASLTQRRRYQQETGLTYALWRDGFNTYLDNIREDTKHSERKVFLETLGISESVTADDFYNEYLGGQSDIIKFVDTVETSATREQIQQHEDIIRQLGNAFGYESSEVIDHLIHGVRNVKDDIDNFTREVRQKVNTADVLSNPLLSRIEEDSREGEGEEQISAINQPEPAKEVHKKAAPVKKAEPAMATRFKATPIEKVNLEEEPEPPKQKEPAEKRPTGPVQVYPAPLREEKRDDKHLMTKEELATAVQLLSDDDKIDQGPEIIDQYARTLYTMMQEYGNDFVSEKAENAVQRVQRTLQKIGLKSAKRSRSTGWYFQAIAKFRFLADNPDIQETRPDGREYEAYDPLLHYHVGLHSYEGQQSHKAEEDIINGILGWEVYRQRKKVKDIFLHLNPLMAPSDKRSLEHLLAEPPQELLKALPTYKLRAIGRLIQANIPQK